MRSVHCDALGRWRACRNGDSIVVYYLFTAVAYKDGPRGYGLWSLRAIIKGQRADRLHGGNVRGTTGIDRFLLRSRGRI